MKNKLGIRNKELGIRIGIVFLFSIIYLLFTSQAHAATLYVSPSTGSYSVGSTFTVSVRSNTQAQDVNTAEANLSYSTDTLTLVSVTQGSTFYLPAPGSPAKGTGTFHFVGGLPSPGYNGTGGILGTATFRARAVGTGTISVDSGHVLLNDGNGTDVFSTSTGARYTINAATVAVGGPEVSSSSHPDPNAWYPKSEADLSWTRPTNAYGFSFELDQIADTVPDNTLDTTITTTKSYPDLKDGVWYFHIKARPQSSSAAFGAVTNFKIQIDTTKPLSFEIKQAPTNQINFEAKDETSGIDHYDVYIDGSLVRSQATTSFSYDQLKPGMHSMKVAAFDKAGNEQDATTQVSVVAPAGFLQTTLTLPLYSLAIIGFLLLLLIILVLWLIWRRRKKPSKSLEIASIQAEIDESLEKLKRDINEKLIRLAAKSTKDALSSEAKTVKEVTVKVNKTRKKIDNKIGKLGRKVPKQKDDDKILG